MYSSISYRYMHIWIYHIGVPEQVLDDLTIRLIKKKPNYNNHYSYQYRLMESKKFLSSDSIVGMAASMLLHGRNSQLCIPQAVNSVILYTGHCSKMVWTTY